MLPFHITFFEKYLVVSDMPRKIPVGTLYRVEKYTA
jgi:hypothetical protein